MIDGTNRVLCLGCPFLIPRPEFKHRVDTYLHAFEHMGKQLELSGNPAEAMEHRRLADQCRKLRHEMRLLEQAELAPHGALAPVNCLALRRLNWAVESSPRVAWAERNDVRRQCVRVLVVVPVGVA